MKKIEKVDQYIKKAPEVQSVILENLRELISKSLPQTKEVFKWGRPVYATEKNFAYLKFTKSHVNLGFFNFDKINDPDNLLEGTGKRMRHIKIVNLADFDKEELKRMIKQASEF